MLIVYILFSLQPETKNVQSEINNNEIKKTEDKLLVVGSSNADINEKVKKIQSSFKIYEDMTKLNAMRMRRNKTCKIEAILWKKTYLLCQRCQRVQFLIEKETKQLKFNIFDPLKNETQYINGIIFQYDQCSPEEFQEEVEKQIKRLRYNKDTGLYYLKSDKPEENSEIINSPIKHNTKEEKEVGLKIFSGSRKVGGLYYDIEVYLNKDKSAFVKYIKNSLLKGTIKINFKFTVYLQQNQQKDKEELLGRFIFEGVLSNYKGDLYVDEGELQKRLALFRCLKNMKDFHKVRHRFCCYLAQTHFHELRIKNCLKMTLLSQLGLQMGTQLHSIKILKKEGNDKIVYFKSNKATNTLGIPLGKLLPTNLQDENITSYTVTAYIRNHVAKFLAFNIKKKELVWFTRRIKSITSLEEIKK